MIHTNWTHGINNNINNKEDMKSRGIYIYSRDKYIFPGINMVAVSVYDQNTLYKLRYSNNKQTNVYHE